MLWAIMVAIVLPSIPKDNVEALNAAYSVDQNGEDISPLSPSLVPRPRPSTRELRGSGDFSRFSWHFVRFKSCDTCLCACAFQQQARTAHCVVPRGRGLGSRHT